MGSAKEDRLVDLQRKIRESVPVPEAAGKNASWKLVSSSGAVLGQLSADVSITEALEL